MARITRKQKFSVVPRFARLVASLGSIAILFCVILAHERKLMSGSLLDEYVAKARELQNKYAEGTTSGSPVIDAKLHTIPGEPSSDHLWTVLVKHASELSGDKRPGVAMEVGMHSATQCLEAAKAGLEAHCFEPSPTSFDRVKRQVESQAQNVRDRVSIYNKAASSTSEGTVNFKSSGGTGDHVGEFDMWRMKKMTADHDMKGDIVQVPQIKLDDIVSKQEDGVFVLKVDTQGFEPVVFSGLMESLKQHKIQFILMEYWPRGMDLHAGKQDACVAADLLAKFIENGYTLYALTVLAHPKAPQSYKHVVNERPLDGLRENCEWYFDLEKRFPSDEYKMGYWSDILAVAPNAAPDQEQLLRVLGK